MAWSEKVLFVSDLALKTNEFNTPKLSTRKNEG